jgi:transglutaminase-like putative cysteine protease
VVPPTSLSLLYDVAGLQAHDPDLVMFTARTSVPTYWQVASLDILAAGTWEPDPATVAAMQGIGTPAPGSAPNAGSGSAAHFTAAVTLDHLASLLLPAPPATDAVAGPAILTTQGVVASRSVVPGYRYATQALVPGADPGVGAAPATGDLSIDTGVPPVPVGVDVLAHQVVGSATAPLAQAEALEDWFRSDRFRYSLTAPPVSLVTFLTTRRVGSCQQFAGAFALLARSLGLPSRVAVGFTAGLVEPGGTTVVRGIDAHAWPQVAIDGHWVSFEPTPSRASGGVAPPGVVGPTGLGRPNPAGPPPTFHVVPTTLAPIRPLPVAPARTAGAWWVWPVVAVVVIAAALVTTWVGSRRRRRRGRSPQDRVGRAWTRVDRALARGGRARPPWCSPSAHLRFLAAGTPEGDEDYRAALRDAQLVADIGERVLFDPVPVGSDEVTRAEAAASRSARVLRRPRSGPGRASGDHPVSLRT